MSDRRVVPLIVRIVSAKQVDALCTSVRNVLQAAGADVHSVCPAADVDTATGLHGADADADDPYVGFGKWSTTRCSEVPDHYWDWVVDNVENLEQRYPHVHAWLVDNGRI